MRILIYGAGPIGSFFAAKLGESEQDVTILARESRLRTLSRYWIVLENQDGVETARFKVPTLERLSPVDAYDLVLVAVGKNHYPGVLPFLAANISTPNILFLGNNAEGPGEMVRLLGRERVLFGFPGVNAMIDGRVVRYKVDEMPSLTLGELDGIESERITWIKELFEGAGFEVNVSPNMETWLKYHSAVILPLALAYARAGRDVKEFNRDREGLNLMIRAIREGFGVLQALGHTEVPSGLRRLERLPMKLATLYLRRELNKVELEYVLTKGEAMQDELMALHKEFQGLISSTSVQTPSYDELSQNLQE